VKKTSCCFDNIIILLLSIYLIGILIRLLMFIASGIQVLFDVKQQF